MIRSDWKHERRLQFAEPTLVTMQPHVLRQKALLMAAINCLQTSPSDLLMPTRSDMAPYAPLAGVGSSGRRSRRTMQLDEQRLVSDAITFVCALSRGEEPASLLTAPTAVWCHVVRLPFACFASL